MHIEMSSLCGIAVILFLVILSNSAGRVWSQGTTGLRCSENAEAQDGCNTLAGSAYNQIESGVAGVTISGGGQRTWPNRVI